MRRIAAAAVLLLAAACAQPPVREDVTLDFSRDSDHVTVTAQTTFDLEPRTPAAVARVEEARTAALSSTDAWSARFARVTPEVEELTFRKRGGALERVVRSGRIRTHDLQQLFSDTSITISVVDGEGWRELAMYPGTSTRASREVQREFDEGLQSWSAEVARYVTAIQHLYAYMDENPQRARYLFAAVLHEKDAVVLEDEQPLVDAVMHAMDDIATRMDVEEASGVLIAEAADLIFNPFPARMKVSVPGDVLGSTGFTNELVIEPVDLLDALTALEGRWVSPDPLVALLQDQSPTSETLATRPRRAESVVPPSAIAAAVREQLTRPRSYIVRWRN